MDLPTVCIVNAKAKSGFTRINQSDFDQSVHTLYEPEAEPAPEAVMPVQRDADGSLVAGKGPRGRWYVKRGGRIVTGPYPDEATAKAAAENG